MKHLLAALMFVTSSSALADVQPSTSLTDSYSAQRRHIAEDQAKTYADQINESLKAEVYITHYQLTEFDPALVFLVHWSNGTVCEMTQVLAASPLSGPEVAVTLSQACPGEDQLTYYIQLEGQKTFIQQAGQ